MFAKERQDAIIEQLNQKGSVKVKDLSLKYQVTEDCIRKDLALLEKKGLLKKTYGGAMSLRTNPHLYSSVQRKDMNDEERQMLAKKAVSLLKDEDTIYLDISRTNVEIAKILTTSNLSVHVITNMIEILDVLRNHPHISVVLIGGELNKERDGFWGGLSMKIVQSFKFDVAFLGVVGVDLQQGKMSTYYVDDGLMKQQIITQSQRSYLLCEQRKLREDGQFIYGDLSEVDGIVLASSLHEDEQNLLNEYGVEIV